MKIEQLIAQYLYKNKKVMLQGMGVFTLLPDIALPADNEKELRMPENAILFEYNAKSGEDEGLINFIVQQTRKIKPLATSDLESYIILSKQILNIGKPLWIEGIGTLAKTQQNEYEFIAGGFISPKMEGDNAPLREKTEEEISFRSQAKPSGNNKSILALLIFIGVIIIIAISWFFIHKKNNPANDIIAPNVADTTYQSKGPATKNVPGTLLPEPTFKVVLKEYTNYATAYQAYSKFTNSGHKLLLYTKDSTTFKIAIPFIRPLQDTTVVKDSLKSFSFGGNMHIEI